MITGPARRSSRHANKRPDQARSDQAPRVLNRYEWTCVVGELEGGGRMVTVATWRDGAIAEEYIWI